MKLFKVFVFGLLVSMGVTHAEEPSPPTMNHVRHYIMNSYVDQGMNYELNDPVGRHYVGYLNPGEAKTINLSDTPENLYGVYTLQYRVCKIIWLRWTCESHNKFLPIRKNEDVVWEITPKEIKVTESEM